MYVTYSILTLLSLISSTLTIPTSTTHSPFIRPRPLPLPVRTVAEFPKGTWLENVAVRPNDAILATLVTSPDLYQISPLSLYPPILIHSFANYTSLLGITEVAPDTFYVITGNFSLKTFSPSPGSNSVFEVDFRTFSRTKNTPATVRKVADFPTATFLNGATTLSRETGEILLADSGAGVVWKLNVRTGASSVVIGDEPLMKPVPGSSLQNGINGLHIRNGVLYFSNSNQETLNSVPINSDGTATGPAKAIASGLAVDDFALDARGQAYLTLNAENEVAKVTVPEGEATVLAGSPEDVVTVAGPAAAAFGRGLVDRASLYVVTNGGISGYSSGNFSVGGRVSRIDVGLYGYYG
ncbi:MAG: hypothetical protein Q9219_002162 [cf. Caloplaca sp. 3 TL-2023]